MQVAGRVPTVPFGNMEKVQRAVVIIGLVKWSVKEAAGRARRPRCSRTITRQLVNTADR